MQLNRPHEIQHKVQQFIFDLGLESGTPADSFEIIELWLTNPAHELGLGGGPSRRAAKGVSL